MIVFRCTPLSYPLYFLWESANQPPGRWHGAEEGPVHYFTDTPDGAWAELLRHEEIRDPADLAGIRAALWAVEIDDSLDNKPKLPIDILTGGQETWSLCQEEARRLRGKGVKRLVASSAALLPGCAHGWRAKVGIQPGPRRDGRVIILFEPQSNLIGWVATKEGRPDERLLPCIRHFS